MGYRLYSYAYTLIVYTLHAPRTLVRYFNQETILNIVQESVCMIRLDNGFFACFNYVCFSYICVHTTCAYL